MSPKPIAIFLAVMAVILYFLMNTSMIQDQTLKWVEKNPQSPDAPTILLRAAIWCDWTGGDEEALRLYQALLDKYPDARPQCAQALYEMASIFAQGTARRNANQFLERLFNEYEDQEKWRLKGKALWDEVNHVL